MYNTKFLGDSVSSCHSYRHIAGTKVDASENNFDEKVTAPNLKDSGSDNSGSVAERKKEVMREL